MNEPGAVPTVCKERLRRPDTMAKRHEKNAQHRKKRIYSILLTVNVLVLAVSGFLFVRTLIQNQQVKIEERSAQRIDAPDMTQVQDDTSETEDLQLLIPEEYRHLYEQNSDFIGIVRFADMSLYVCRGRDNSYYLSHTFDGSENPAGMIFLDANCVFEAGDNFLLHGHNMDNGSRFGKLKRFLRRQYLEANPVFIFDTIHGSYQYCAAAVVKASFDPENRNYFSYQVARFENETEFDAYIARAKELSAYDTGFTPVYGKPLLLLSTCTDKENERLVIICGEI